MSTPRSNLLTRGQASRLVLDMVPTADNRRKGNDIMDNNVVDVTYTEDQGPQHPFVMGKSIVEKNPFTYKTYPRTPPTSPTLYPNNTVDNDNIDDLSNSSNNDNSDDSDSSVENLSKTKTSANGSPNVSTKRILKEGCYISSKIMP